MNAQENKSHYGELHRIDTPALGRSSLTDEEEWKKNQRYLRGRVFWQFLDKYVPEYTRCDKGKLSDSAAFEAAVYEPPEDQDWDPGYKSSRYLFGPTGTGKTLAAVECVKRTFMKDNEQVCWWSSYDLKQKLFALRNDVDRKEWFISWLSDYDCLLAIDDFGLHISESCLESMLEILKARKYGTLIVTSMYSLDEFVNRCKEKDMRELGEAIARRLYENCQCIEFKRGRKVVITVPVNQETVPACAAKPSDSEKAPAM